MTAKRTARSSGKSPGREVKLQESLESKSPLELVSLVQQSLEKHLEWEARQQQLEEFQSRSTELLNTIIRKLDEQALPDFPALQLELAESRKDAASKIGGLQTALTLNHEKQQALEKEIRELEEKLSEATADIDKLRSRKDETEQRCAAMQREMTVLQTANQNAVDQRDEFERENIALQKQLSEHRTRTNVVREQDDLEPDTDRIELKPKPKPVVVVSNPVADGNQQFWESQKSELFKKYGIESETPEGSPVEFRQEDQPDEGLEKTSGSPPDHAVAEQENFEDSPEPETTPEEPESHAEDLTRTSISQIDEPDSIKSCNLSPIIPVVDSQAGKVDETVRRREVELSLERARISRKRKALEDKIVALKSEMATEKEQKGGLLSRMKKFLGGDNRRSKEIEVMKDMIDKIADGNAPKFEDPRDQPFFKVDIDEMRKSTDEPAEAEADQDEVASAELPVELPVEVTEQQSAECDVPATDRPGDESDPTEASADDDLELTIETEESDLSEASSEPAEVEVTVAENPGKRRAPRSRAQKMESLLKQNEIKVDETESSDLEKTVKEVESDADSGKNRAKKKNGRNNKAKKPRRSRRRR